MFRLILIATVVALVTNVGTHYFVSGDINSAERRASAQSRSIVENFTSADENIKNLIQRTNNLVNSYAGRLNMVQESAAASNEMINTELITIKSEQEGSSKLIIDVMAQANSFESRIKGLEGEVSSIVEPLGQLRDDLQELRSRLTPSTGDFLSSSSVAEGEREGFEAFAYSEPCPQAALNRDEQLPRLRRAMERSTVTGAHDVTVKFDIDQDGSPVLQDLESDTAPVNLMGAVRRYVNGLVFDNVDSTFTDCEMIVKLDIG
jgi:predicted DNA-binding protein YlxM (UPF0122 family)